MTPEENAADAQRIAADWAAMKRTDEVYKSLTDPKRPPPTITFRSEIEKMFHALYPDPNWVEEQLEMKPVKDMTDAEIDARITELERRGVRP